MLSEEQEYRIVSCITTSGEKFGASATTTQEALEILEKFVDEHVKGSKNLMYLRIDRWRGSSFIENLVTEDRRPWFPERHIDNRTIDPYSDRR